MGQCNGGRRLVKQEFDWAETPPSIAVSYALASLEKESVESLPPLYEYVGSESLDAFITGSENASVSFPVCEYVVEIIESTVAINRT